MPGMNVVPDLGVNVSNILRRVEALEQRKGQRLPRPFTPAIFSNPGAVEQDVESPPWYAYAPVTFTTIRVSLTEASSSNIIVTTYLDGTAQFTTTLTAGLTTVLDGIYLPVEYGQAMTVMVTSVFVGTAEKMSVIFQPKAS